MTRPVLLIALVAALIGLASVSSAGDDSFKIIVHPDNPVTDVDRELVQAAYLKKSLEWDHGEPIRPIDLATSFSARERFTREVLKKTPAQLKSYWNQQIFSGKGVPPPEADSTAAMIAYVLANPGAIGYLPADVDPGGAKVVRLK